MTKKISSRRRKAPPKQSGAVMEANVEQSVVHCDGNLLDKAQSDWQRGDWQGLVQLSRYDIEHHTARAQLAILAAVGHFQMGAVDQARHLVRLAEDWGCSKKMLIQALLAGGYNNLGRMATVSGEQTRAIRLFERSLQEGAFDGIHHYPAILRANEQRRHLNLASLQDTADGVPENAPDLQTELGLPAPIIEIEVSLGSGKTVRVPMFSNEDMFKNMDGTVFFDATERGHVYLNGREDTKYQNPPKIIYIRLEERKNYLIQADLNKLSGDAALWGISYSKSERLTHFIEQIMLGACVGVFNTGNSHSALCLLLRLAGKGSIAQYGHRISIKEADSNDIERLRLARFGRIFDAKKILLERRETHRIATRESKLFDGSSGQYCNAYQTALAYRTNC